MMSELTRLKDEATRLLTVYEEYKDSTDEFKRRKAHLDLDRFLMEHREVAMVLMVQGLQDAFDQLVAELKEPQRRAPWYKRLLRSDKHVSYRTNKEHKETTHAQ